MTNNATKPKMLQLGKNKHWCYYDNLDIFNHTTEFRSRTLQHDDKDSRLFNVTFRTEVYEQNFTFHQSSEIESKEITIKEIKWINIKKMLLLQYMLLQRDMKLI